MSQGEPITAFDLVEWGKPGRRLVEESAEWRAHQVDMKKCYSEFVASYAVIRTAEMARDLTTGEVTLTIRGVR